MNTLISAQDLRAELMAPEAMKRVHALHALEREADKAPAPLARETEDFAARGIPFYSPEDPYFREWVGKAVRYWEKLHTPAPRLARMTAKRR